MSTEEIVTSDTVEPTDTELVRYITQNALKHTQICIERSSLRLTDMLRILLPSRFTAQRRRGDRAHCGSRFHDA